MKSLIDKFATVEKNISDEKTGFVLFALFLREEAQDKWDLVLSAKWFEDDKKKTLDYIVKKIKNKLKLQNMTRISRIILLHPFDQFVKTINNAIKIEHGKTEIIDCQFNNIFIKHAFIITSKR